MTERPLSSKRETKRERFSVPQLVTVRAGNQCILITFYSMLDFNLMTELSLSPLIWSNYNDCWCSVREPRVSGQD